MTTHDRNGRHLFIKYQCSGFDVILGKSTVFQCRSIIFASQNTARLLCRVAPLRHCSVKHCRYLCFAYVFTRISL
ncbi:hypothetical protein Y032_0041g347 [Ancylostoma ceylanicum]|uniref:Uncharacterized protein n=1 Tax=Ancylostoma ceylanicum TaxID=53326 RepID=A0A016UH31_9BILA|nr:hypothetical protein Y032_0041g347 [Ancylostoma ceylanicum]